MATEQELQAQVESLRAEKAALENKVNVLSSGADDVATLAKQNKELSDRFAAIDADNKAMKLEREKELILKAHPDAVNFADMVTGSTKEEMAASAKKIADRIAIEKANAAGAKQKEIEAQWGKITPGPSAMVLNQDEFDKKMEAAKAKGLAGISEMIKLKFQQPKKVAA